MNQSGELLSLVEVSRIMGGISTQTIRRMISRGELVAYRVGARKYRVRHEDLEAYFIRCRVVPQSEATTCPNR